MKKVLFIFFLAFSVSQAQVTISGNVTDKVSDWMVLYQLKGVKHLYIANATLQDSTFVFTMPEQQESGLYRLLFSQTEQGYVDFIYDGNPVSMTFSEQAPTSSLTFTNSPQNKLFTNYSHTSEKLISTIDSLQMAYFSASVMEKTDIESRYNDALQDYESFHSSYMLQSEGLWVHSLLKAMKKYRSTSIVASPQEYYNSMQQHFFDFIDFSDKQLQQTTFLSERIIEYVFYMHQSDDSQMQQVLYEQAIKKIFSLVGDQYALQSEVIELLLHSFSQLEDVQSVHFIIVNYYNQLPDSFKDTAFVEEVTAKMKVALGSIAPDFSWKENNKLTTLHSLTGADFYVIVFWSTECSHCLEEIPLLYKYSKEFTNTNVVAFAMENTEKKFNEMKQQLQGWTTVLGLGKWQNETARMYQINATPTYFILDADKKIIAKPDYASDVKHFFEN